MLSNDEEKCIILSLKTYIYLEQFDNDVKENSFLKLVVSKYFIKLWTNDSMFGNPPRGEFSILG